LAAPPLGQRHLITDGLSAVKSAIATLYLT